MKKLSLNALQIQHQTSPCVGKKCALPECGNCLCGKRSDAEFCCDEHKALKNNRDLAIKDYHYNLAKQLNKKNTIIIEDLERRKYIEIDLPALKLAGFDTSVSPVAGMIDGRKVAIYGKVAMWIDDLKMFHLNKIK